MPFLDAASQLALGVVPPTKGDQEINPERKVKKLAVLDSGNYRRKITLKPEELTEVKNLLSDCYEDWKSNSSFLHQKLLKYNNKLEGITQAKDKPWPGSCNLSIPLPEMHILSLHSIVTQTILDNDPVYFCRELRPGESEQESVDPNLEWFLTWVTKVQSRSDLVMSECFYNAMATPLTFMVKDWVEEIGKEYRVDLYESIDEFQKEYPDAASMGGTDAQYESYIKEILSEGKLALQVEEKVVQYRGPSSRAVELKDFVIAPAASRSLKYSTFHGDKFRERSAYFTAGVKNEWFDKVEVDLMLKSPGKDQATDDISSQQDRIEGISSSNKIRSKYSRAYDCVRGNLKWDRDDDGIEEIFAVIFHPESKALLRIEQYPYWHNRTNYIPFKMRTRTGRLQGRCVMDMVWDISEEVDTQHHLRIDSRAIATVPSFKKNILETNIDFSRKDQHFYPGVVFPVSKMDGLMQLEIRQAGMDSSLQEEQTLFQIAVWLVGNDPAMRAGTNSNKDPRASGKKAASQIQQSNQRVDDYIKEFIPSVNESGKQDLELYYQFSPDSVIKFSMYDESTGAMIQREIARAKLRNRNLHINVARATVLDSPDAVLQRALVTYQLFSKEPMIGGNMQRRHELLKRTLFAMRDKDPGKLLPPLKQMIEEQKQQLAAAQQDPATAQMHEGLQKKAGEGDSKGKKEMGQRQGGPDVSLNSLGKKGP